MLIRWLTATLRNKTAPTPAKAAPRAAEAAEFDTRRLADVIAKGNPNDPETISNVVAQLARLPDDLEP